MIRFCSMKYCLPFLFGFALVLDAGFSATPQAERASSIGELFRDGDLAATQKALGDRLLSAGVAGLGHAEMQIGLARHEFIRACGAKALGDLEKREGGARFLRAFLGDPSWVESFLISEPPTESYAQAAENLFLLHHYGKDLNQPLYRRLATAMALTAGKMNGYLLVERFGQIQHTHREGLLHTSFDQLAVREMRWTLNLYGNAAEYEYMVNDRQTSRRDYFSAQWAVAYRNHNDYGDWIQQSWFHTPFRHAWQGLRAAREVGGVCGSCSTYAVLAARTHGLMAKNVGQPGHNAFVVRVGEEYPVGYSVAWPTSTAAPGWDGTSYATMHRLYEPVSKDAPRLLAANRALWLANLQIERARPHAEWSESFDRAIAAQPLNYEVWLKYAKALAAAKVTPSLDLARRAVKTFTPYPEAAWALVQRFAGKPLAALKPEERMAFLLECHAELREEKADRFTDYPFEDTLTWQAKSLGKDPALAVGFFAKLAEIHTAKAPATHFFNRVLGWGSQRFAANPETAPLFGRAMELYFRDRGDAADATVMRNPIGDGFVAAGKAGDIPAFRMWAQMAARLLPAPKPADVHLNEKQAAAFPKCEPFPGAVLSAQGLFKVSSGWPVVDRPITYSALLRPDGFGGYFETYDEVAPWAMVQLPGEGELSGIVIVGRYELGSSYPAEWTLPLKVSISSDGKAWTEVATFATMQPEFRVDLAGKSMKASFVKAERVPGRNLRFFLRKILVFGKPLY
jgi:hypothetical protein